VQSNGGKPEKERSAFFPTHPHHEGGARKKEGKGEGGGRRSSFYPNFLLCWRLGKRGGIIVRKRGVGDRETPTIISNSETENLRGGKREKKEKTPSNLFSSRN